MLQIRMTTPLDAPDILDIYRWYIEHTSTSFELVPPSIEDYANRIKNYLATAPWLVAINDDKIVGYAYASPHRGRAAYEWNREVSVYVQEAFHSKGVAKKLYLTLFQLLKLQGVANVLAGIVPPNPKSIHFHKKMGFQLIGRYHNIGYKFDRWWDVIWYELFLQPDNFQPKPLLNMSQLIEHTFYQKILNE